MAVDTTPFIKFMRMIESDCFVNKIHENYENKWKDTKSLILTKFSYKEIIVQARLYLQSAHI